MGVFFTKMHFFEFCRNLNISYMPYYDFNLVDLIELNLNKSTLKRSSLVLPLKVREKSDF